jgi:hypothetical protein
MWGHPARNQPLQMWGHPARNQLLQMWATRLSAQCFSMPHDLSKSYEPGVFRSASWSGKSVFGN